MYPTAAAWLDAAIRSFGMNPRDVARVFAVTPHHLSHIRHARRTFTYPQRKAFRAYLQEIALPEEAALWLAAEPMVHPMHIPAKLSA